MLALAAFAAFPSWAGSSTTFAPRHDDFRPAAAAADSSLDPFLQQLSDSTSDYFGMSTAKSDTAGDDSVLAWRLQHPVAPPRHVTRLLILPDFSFERVDGPTYWLVSGIDLPQRLGHAGGQAGYASGPNDFLWEARYSTRSGPIEPRWQLEVSGGERTWPMAREERVGHLTTLAAFLSGHDGHQYLRRSGARARLRGTLRQVDLLAGVRDEVESPIATSASWNLARKPLKNFANLPALYGRAREVELGAGFDVPRAPIRLEVMHTTSGAAIGSDFEYRRTLLTGSSTVGLGRAATLVTQMAYGHVSGEFVPQAAFYLGGASLRSLSDDTYGGTGIAAGRIEVIGSHDVLAELHVPYPHFLPLQLGLFAGTGAVWGKDPFGGPTQPGVDWPRDRVWLSETGASLIYQPGVPDPTSTLRLNVAWPLGHRSQSARISVEASHVVDFTGHLGR